MIYFITGNPDKLAELRTILPQGMSITHRSLELDEIQSLDLHEIVRRKLHQAHAIVHEPVIVEDVAAELASLNSLPGPFIKFFMKRLGDDALYEIGADNDRVKIICTMGFYDGECELIVDGVVEGKVVAPRGQGGFGFDATVVPDGYDQTFAELGDPVKNSISHRRRAADAMIASLKQAGIC